MAINGLYKRAKRLNLISYGKFTIFAYKSLIIVVENVQNYHWNQHKKTQPVNVPSKISIEPSGLEIFPNSKNFQHFLNKPIIVSFISLKLSKLKI